MLLIATEQGEGGIRSLEHTVLLVFSVPLFDYVIAHKLALVKGEC